MMMAQHIQDVVLQGLDRGLRDAIANLFRVYLTDKPSSTAAFEKGLAAAAAAYRDALDTAEEVYGGGGFDLFGTEPERETTGADYGTDDP